MPGPSVVVVYSHPYPRRSRAGQALLAAVEELPFVAVRSLYDLYPDFAITPTKPSACRRRCPILKRRLRAPLSR